MNRDLTRQAVTSRHELSIPQPEVPVPKSRVPLATPDPRGHMPLVVLMGRRILDLMSSCVAEKTSRNDVSRGVFSSILDRPEMFGCALKALCRFRSNA